jgi:hypothetical protein
MGVRVSDISVEGREERTTEQVGGSRHDQCMEECCFRKRTCDRALYLVASDRKMRAAGGLFRRGGRTEDRRIVPPSMDAE